MNKKAETKEKDKEQKKRSRVAVVIMPFVFLVCIILGVVTINSLVDTTEKQMQTLNRFYAERYNMYRINRHEFEKNRFAIDLVEFILEDGMMEGAILVAGSGDILASTPEVTVDELGLDPKYSFAGMLGRLMREKGPGTYNRRYDKADYIIIVTEVTSIKGSLITYAKMKDIMADVISIVFLTILVIVVFILVMFVLVVKQDRTTNNLGKQLNAEEVLIKCARCLANNRDFHSSILELLGYLTEYYQSTKAYIFLVNFNENLVNCEYLWDSSQKEGLSSNPKLHNIPVAEVQPYIDLMNGKGFLRIIDRQSQLNPDTWGYHFMFDQDIYSILGVPLQDENGRVAGVLAIGDPEVNIDTVDFLMSVASFVKEEIIKKKYTDMLLEMSYNDKMTKLYNRQAYMGDIERLSKEGTKNVGVLFADVNGLKETNDKMGHEKGDELIIRASGLLRKVFNRPEDLVYRIGGDEFVVLSKSISEYEFNEDVQTLLDDLGAPPVMSIGETWIETCEKLEEQVKKADERMYERKSEYYSKYMERRQNRRGRRE